MGLEADIRKCNYDLVLGFQVARLGGWNWPKGGFLWRQSGGREEKGNLRILLGFYDLLVQLSPTSAASGHHKS